MNSRILLFLMTLLLVPLLTYFVILFARGYRPGLNSSGQTSLQATGILAATSLPEGAQLYINGEFKSATNTNLNLPPGRYEIEIKKDTYYPWKKTLEVKPEEVTRASAVLFPTVPALKSITTTGAAMPTLSPDGTKVAFIQAVNNRVSLFVLDLSDSPLGILNRDPRLLSTQNSPLQTLSWSPDSKQILAQASASALLVDLNSSNTPAAVASPSGLLANWKVIYQTRERQKFEALPVSLQSILATSAANLVWSPREDKLMYTATASATIVPNLVRPLPGSSTQSEERNITPNTTYIYDLEEDRNFKISVASPSAKLSWFPTSNHLVQVEKGKVIVLEYDGTNSTVVYSGPMENGYAFPYPSSRQLLILANLNPTISKFPNLYAVSLR